MRLSFSKTKRLLSLSSSSGIFSGYAFHPTVVNMNLTYRCNLACDMCWQRKGRENHGLFHQALEEELNLEAWARIIGYFQSFKPSFFLWGGEPFLHPHLLDLIALIKKQGTTCEVNTNGAYLIDKARELVALELDFLLISLDGLEDVHDRLRGFKGTYKKIEKGLEILQKVKKDKKSLKPEVRINMTITPMNYRYISQISGMLPRWGVTCLTVSHLWFTSYSQGRNYHEEFLKYFARGADSWKGYVLESPGIELEVLDEELMRIKQSLRGTGIRLEIFPDLTPGEMKEYYYGQANLSRFRKCWVPWFVAGIQPNGDLVSCSDFPDYVIGNLKKNEFSHLWNNRQFRKFRQVMNRQGLFSICQRCCGLFTLNPNPAVKKPQSTQR